MHRSPALILAALALLSSSASAREDQHAKIESVDGAKTVLLQSGIALREVAVGDAVEFGERIRTDEKTTVTLLYADGSHLIIMPNSDLAVDEPQGKIQSSELRSGLVQGQVPKASKGSKDGAPLADPGAAGASKPIKFVIRTRTAVMGVRGTEFVAGFNGATGVAQFNTLEGTVEVASDPARLLAGGGVPVPSGKFVQATADGMSAVRSFNGASFRSDLPGMAQAMKPAPQVAEAPGTPAAGEIPVAPPPPHPPIGGAPPPTMPVAPVPPPPPPAVADQQKAAAEAEKPHMHLLAFALSGIAIDFAGGIEAPIDTFFKAFELSWTPVVPLPVLSFLYLRGNAGLTFFEGLTLTNGFQVEDLQGYLGTSVLRPFFVEVGGGEQIWRVVGINPGLLSANVGLSFGENARFNRVFVGLSQLFTGQWQPPKSSSTFEIRVGVGLSIF